MHTDKQSQLKRIQIEQFLKKEFERNFKGRGRISIRKRQKFMDRIRNKVSQRFGRDVLCLIDFSKQGFVTLVSPSTGESTDKGRVHHSFCHPQVVYTTHCIDRFSERTGTSENCIYQLDAYLKEAFLTFGVHPKHLVCSAGVFAYVVESDRLVIKTFISYDMLSDDQIVEFYGMDVISALNQGLVSENLESCDILLQDEHPQS